MTGASPGSPPPARFGGILYVVATPIGNLGDVTLRALEVLRAVPLIAAEDTRVSKRLLARHDIPTRMVSYHARSGPGRVNVLLDHLRAGEDLALITDAGTPLVSDPGEDLVGGWIEAGGRVVPVPGASAVLAALAASGMPAARWGFEGFLPRRGRERRERLGRIATDDRTTVIFEAPTRLAATVRDLAVACGSGRQAAICRELTKMHEQIARGTLAELEAALDAGEIPSRGEAVLVVAGRHGPAGDPEGDPLEARRGDGEGIDAARAKVAALVGQGMGRSEAARHVAATTGIPRRQLYAAPKDD